jgi:hypothetical protein
VLHTLIEVNEKNVALVVEHVLLQLLSLEKELVKMLVKLKQLQ